MLTKLVVPSLGINKAMRINGNLVDLKVTSRVYKYRDLFPLDVISAMGKDPDDTVTASIHKSKFHLRWMYSGWPCVIEVACMTKGGDVGWRIAFNGCGNETLTNCFDGRLLGEIPEPVSPLNACNIFGYSASSACSLFDTNGDYSRVPALTTDTTKWDLSLDDALYLDNLPLFRTWHLTHEVYGAKYSTDPLAFKELDLDHDGNIITYELQMNDALSYRQSSYDDAAFVFYKSGV